MMSGLPTATVFSYFQGKFQTKINLLNDDLLKELCDCNCVILRTNRARCALNMEILDLLIEESVSGAMFEKVSRSLKYGLNFIFFHKQICDQICENRPNRQRT